MFFMLRDLEGGFLRETRWDCLLSSRASTDICLQFRG